MKNKGVLIFNLVNILQVHIDKRRSDCHSLLGRLPRQHCFLRNALSAISCITNSPLGMRPEIDQKCLIKEMIHRLLLVSSWGHSIDFCLYQTNGIFYPLNFTTSLKPNPHRNFFWYHYIFKKPDLMWLLIHFFQFFLKSWPSTHLARPHLKK